MIRKQLDIIYYDTETTGLDSSKERIIEIAFFKESDQSSINQLVNPSMPIPEASTKIHNITNDMVKASPTFDQIVNDLIAFAPNPTLFVAHNNDAFDIHFMNAEFRRCSKDLPKHWIFIDSLKWSRKFRPNFTSHRLQHLRKMFGIAENNAHRALDDVVVLRKIFRNLTVGLTNLQIAQLMGKEDLVNACTSTRELKFL
ncbi:exonuclease domain-containing protein [Chlamydiia bacterium]|nr:exonuclease domain-containing protein [Chlamydiia bacterium]